MVCRPTVRVEVGKLARVPLRATGAPTLLPSTANWTDPLGVPKPATALFTDAVKVTVSTPKSGVAMEGLTLVVVGTRVTFTSCANSDVLPSEAVAVALAHWPGAVVPGTVAVKLALPEASVVTVAEPK
jgi:hypothetical protein